MSIILPINYHIAAINTDYEISGEKTQMANLPDELSPSSAKFLDTVIEIIAQFDKQQHPMVTSYIYGYIKEISD